MYLCYGMDTTRVELIVAMATGHLEVFWQQLPGTDKIIGRDGRVDWGETHTNKALRGPISYKI